MAPKVSYNDANGDGIIDTSEVSVDQCRLPRLGAADAGSLAQHQMGFLRDRVRLGAQFDYRGGHLVDNSIEQFRCFSVVNCRGLVRQDRPAGGAGAGPGRLSAGGRQLLGFFEPGWFIKLRELSLTFDAPDRWAHAFGAEPAEPHRWPGGTSGPSPTTPAWTPR